MKAEGSQQFDNYGGIDGPRVSAEDAASAVMPMDNFQARSIPWMPAAIKEWRAAHPHAVQTWWTERGYVVGFRDTKTYYGTCQRCGADVTVTRPWPVEGRWPSYCDGGECRTQVQAERDDADALPKRKRMKRRRQQDREARDLEFTSRGLAPPRQGYAGDVEGLQKALKAELEGRVSLQPQPDSTQQPFRLYDR